jgi:D-alanyl-D-alanine carboxypeptidase/D-alanyl-D-alanine-endopeptidase (penicillin-binding protein 4)
MKFAKPFYTLALLLLCCSMAYSQNAAQVRKLKTELGKITGSKDFKTATIGFCVMDVETGKVLVETNSEKSLIPASTMKLITTGAGLALLGDTFRFKTELGYTGDIKNGVLDSNLVFTGYGDPTFGSERWDSTNKIITDFFQVLSLKNIRKVKGYIETKQTSFVDNPITPGYAFEDLVYAYGSPVYPFNYRDNTVFLLPDTISFPDLYDPATLHDTIVPRIVDNILLDKSEWTYKNYVNKEKYANHSPAHSFISDLFHYDYNTSHVFSNSLIYSAPILSPLNRTLFVNGHEIKKVKHIYTFYSPQLLDITTKTNHSSINLYAEGILRAISTNKYGYSTLDSSISITRQFWKNEVGDLKGLRMTDGSGLSRSNLCTPLLFCKMLTAYTKRDNFNSFYSTIPIAGREGTVKNFAIGTAAENNARLKSGSMSRVKCYAGYVKGKNGKLYAVSIMFNNFEPDATVTAACAKLIGKVAELKGGKPKKEFVVNRGNK